MKRLRSTLISDISLPYEFELDNAIEFAGLSGFIPITFLTDLIAVSTAQLLGITIEHSEYVEQLISIVKLVQRPLADSVLLVKVLGAYRDLRLIEKYACNSSRNI